MRPRIKYHIIYDKGYSLVEVETVEPYVLDPTPVYFDILPEDSSE